MYFFYIAALIFSFFYSSYSAINRDDSGLGEDIRTTNLTRRVSSTESGYDSDSEGRAKRKKLSEKDLQDLTRRLFDDTSSDGGDSSDALIEGDTTDEEAGAGLNPVLPSAAPSLVVAAAQAEQISNPVQAAADSPLKKMTEEDFIIQNVKSILDQREDLSPQEQTMVELIDTLSKKKRSFVQFLLANGKKFPESKLTFMKLAALVRRADYSYQPPQTDLLKALIESIPVERIDYIKKTIYKMDQSCKSSVQALSAAAKETKDPVYEPIAHKTKLLPNSTLRTPLKILEAKLKSTTLRQIVAASTL